MLIILLGMVYSLNSVLEFGWQFSSQIFTLPNGFPPSPMREMLEHPKGGG